MAGRLLTSHNVRTVVRNLLLFSAPAFEQASLPVPWAPAVRIHGARSPEHSDRVPPCRVPLSQHCASGAVLETRSLLPLVRLPTAGGNLFFSDRVTLIHLGKPAQEADVFRKSGTGETEAEKDTPVLMARKRSPSVNGDLHLRCRLCG